MVAKTAKRREEDASLPLYRTLRELPSKTPPPSSTLSYVALFLFSSFLISKKKTHLTLSFLYVSAEFLFLCSFLFFWSRVSDHRGCVDARNMLPRHTE